MEKINLKAARVNAGIEAKEVAELVGVTTATIYNWEHGKNVPKKIFKAALADIYKIKETEIRW